MAQTCIMTIEGVSPYGPGRMVMEARKAKETPDEHERRCWRMRIWTDAQGRVTIPAMAMKLAIEAACKRLGEQIPGKGKATYTKHFTAGLLSQEDAVLYHDDGKTAWTATEAPGVWRFVPSGGDRGGAKRVLKRFAEFPPIWKATFNVQVLDDAITRDVFERSAIEAGRFVGLGRFRPASGGFNGRFIPAFKWEAGI